MRLENLKNEFPDMPKEMKNMVEFEVEKQVKGMNQKRNVKIPFLTRKIAAASLAAVMILGTTVYAGVKLYRMHSDSAGTYAIETKIDNNAGNTETGDSEKPISIPSVKIETGYLPEGMVQNEGDEYRFEQTPYNGGISMELFRMDTGDNAFRVMDEGVLKSEDITAGGHEGVYLELQKSNDGSLSFNQRMYLYFTDVHYVLQMYIGEDVPKEEALKFASEIRLVPVTDESDAAEAWNWSEYLASMDKLEDVIYVDGGRTSVSKDEMENLHEMGESFSVLDSLNPVQVLTAKVTDVKVTEDTSMLNRDYLDSDFENEVGENGKLRPYTMNYIKSGDGINTIDEVVDTKEVQQKLLYVTVEYKNTGEEELTDVLYMGTVMRLDETADGYSIRQESPKAGDEWDRIEDTTLLNSGEMVYWDVLGGERNNNYISSIKPGETVTVHLGFGVCEEDLAHLYLNLDSCGGTREFTESGLKMGLVDIRQ